MNKEQIMEFLQTMSRSQGFYGRLLENMTDEFMDELVSQNFSDNVELVMYLEG
jgi:hypothetical protein